MSDEKGKYAIIILAAGSSSRLGQPKQLLKKGTDTLLNHIIKVAKSSGVGDVFVVVGSQKDLIIPTLKRETNIIINKDWRKGMGRSIAIGVSQILDLNYDGVIVLLGDQIYLTTKEICNLIVTKDKGHTSIVVSKYKNSQGPPCYFDNKYFEELTFLNDDEGAKSVIKKHLNEVAFTDFLNGEVDIDTPSDLTRLN